MNDVIHKRPVVVGVDGSPSSIDALRKAVELAEPLGSPVEAVIAWQFPPLYDASFAVEGWSPDADAREILARAIDIAFPAGRPRDLKQAVVAGPAAHALIGKSADAAMLVLGSRGRGGFTGLLLGSVSTACAQHAECPVLIMHAPRSRRAD